MKTLLLVRHAKSSWDADIQNDFDRTLNERGKKDAPEMAKRVRDKNILPDLIISSPAKRAYRTARLFADELHYKKDDILVVDNLYEPTVQAFTDAIAAIPDSKNTVIIFSHNPSITEFANSLTQVRIDDMPTCSIFAISLRKDSWSDFATAQKSYLFFDYPKNPLG